MELQFALFPHSFDLNAPMDRHNGGNPKGSAARVRQTEEEADGSHEATSEENSSQQTGAATRVDSLPSNSNDTGSTSINRELGGEGTRAEGRDRQGDPRVLNIIDIIDSALQVAETSLCHARNRSNEGHESSGTRENQSRSDGESPQSNEEAGDTSTSDNSQVQSDARSSVAQGVPSSDGVGDSEDDHYPSQIDGTSSDGQNDSQHSDSSSEENHVSD